MSVPWRGRDAVYVRKLSAFVRSRLGGDVRWQGVFFFLLAYWVAFLINASFDVYLEGPMGGMWFWTVWGVGLAALALFERRPEVLLAAPLCASAAR